MGAKAFDSLIIRKKIKELAPALAQGLKSAAAAAANERQLQSKASRVIEQAAAEMGVAFEELLEHRVATGSIDALYNRFVVEYEKPGVLAAARGRDHSIQQVKDYIGGLAVKEKRERGRYAGVCTDGLTFVFLRYRDGDWRVDPPVPVDERSADTFLQYLAALAVEKPLTAENLVKDFGVGSDLAGRVVPHFYGLLAAGGVPPRAQAIFAQWAEDFSEACDYEEGVAHAKATTLSSAAALFGIKGRGVKPLPLYFAIHTYFALLVKLVALRLALVYRFKRQAARRDDLRADLTELERGDYFDKLGIKNFFEADFFSWYLDAWAGETADLLAPLRHELDRYDFPGTETQPEQYRDILQDLYQDVMPRELRHNLGEYYTPDWLVERILNQLGYDGAKPETRILDPSCGSGTFLYHEIRRVRAKAREKLRDERALLAQVLNNIVGFDLNPVAVTTARTSYLLALGELLDYQVDEDIYFPVYVADSIMTPAAGKSLLDAGARVVPTAVGEFRVPERLEGLAAVSKLMNLIALHGRNQLAADKFLEKARAAFPDLDDRDLGHVRHTYELVRGLEAEGRNGIWGPIVTNAFAPIFAGTFDLIAGNPPWINWEHQPENYRRKTYDVWASYKLFAAKGYEKILGHAKDDISVLMTYVAIDKYLKRNGKLGFVITQSVFKAGKAGMGFRRFQIGDGEKIKVLQVDDMVELKPFPGVGNRTAIMILQKGRETTYPVEYLYWRKDKTKGKVSLRPDMSWSDVQPVIKCMQFKAQPVSSNDYTSAWVTGRTKAVAAAGKVLGKSEYSAREGVNTGGANGVFWLEILETRKDGLLVIRNITEGAKREVQKVEAVLEPDLVYPLLRGRDVNRWSAIPSAYILITHFEGAGLNAISETDMKDKYPHTFKYLNQFKGLLFERKSQSVRSLMEKGPFYSMFAVGEYTFAPWKVVWREVATEIDATYVSKAEKKPVLPDHTIVAITTKTEIEACFVSAIVNSSPYRFCVNNYIVLHPDPHVVGNVRIITFDKSSADHKAIAALSRRAHELAAAGDKGLKPLVDVEAELDERVARLYGITAAELAEIKKSLEELRS